MPARAESGAGEDRNAGARQLSRSKRQHKPQPVRCSSEQPWREAPNSRGEVRAVHRRELSDVHHGLLRQPTRSSWDEHVSRIVRAAEICRERRDDDRPDRTAIECVGLDDHHRPAQGRTGSTRSAEFCPPDLTSADYHALFLTVRRAASRTNGSAASGCAARAASILLVISASDCRSTYSAKASAYSRLRGMRKCFASRSPARNTGSGMETAVFIPELYRGWDRRTSFAVKSFMPQSRSSYCAAHHHANARSSKPLPGWTSVGLDGPARPEAQGASANA